MTQTTETQTTDETTEAPVVETPEVEQTPQADEPKTFDADYVQKLRKEAGDHRVAAKEATARVEALEREVWTLKVAALGKLADPTDLPFEPGADVAEAVDRLLAAKPHLAARRVSGDVGQGNRGPATSSVSLMDMLRG